MKTSRMNIGIGKKSGGREISPKHIESQQQIPYMLRVQPNTAAHRHNLNVMNCNQIQQWTPLYIEVSNKKMQTNKRELIYILQCALEQCYHLVTVVIYSTCKMLRID